VENERYAWKKKCEQNLEHCDLLEKIYWVSLGLLTENMVAVCFGSNMIFL
jgi:hypothetical protein